MPPYGPLDGDYNLEFSRNIIHYRSIVWERRLWLWMVCCGLGIIVRPHPHYPHGLSPLSTRMAAVFPPLGGIVWDIGGHGVGRTGVKITSWCFHAPGRQGSDYPVPIGCQPLGAG